MDRKQIIDRFKRKQEFQIPNVVQHANKDKIRSIQQRFTDLNKLRKHELVALYAEQSYNWEMLLLIYNQEFLEYTKIKKEFNKLKKNGKARN